MNHHCPDNAEKGNSDSAHVEAIRQARLGALEEAARLICEGCAKGKPPTLIEGSMRLWHRYESSETLSGTTPCQAAPIHQLREST